MRPDDDTDSRPSTPSWLRRLTLWDWWFAPRSVYPVVLLRIGLGLVLFFAYVLYYPFLDELWGPEGLFRWSRDLPEPTWLMNNLRLVYAVLLASSLAFAIGLLSRVTGIVMMLCHASIISVGAWHTWGWAPTIVPFIAYTCMAPCGARYSVDAWVRRRLGRPASSETTSGWPLRLLEFHSVCLYLAAAWHRLDDPAWIRGEAMFVAMHDSVFTRFPTTNFFSVKPLLWVGTWGAWLSELFAPIGLLIPRVRVWVALLLIGMHIGLELTSNIGWWQVTMCFVLMLFLPPEWSVWVLEAPGRGLTWVVGKLKRR